ncbi:MAG: hypothetical protein ACI837_002165 [Crocinitomicaceae bacterium]|jgi:hypothetical protein
MLFKFKEKDLYGLIDEKGKIIVPPTYTFVEDSSDGLCGAFKTIVSKSLFKGKQEKSVFVYINEKGEEVIEREPRGLSFFDGYAMAFFASAEKWGFIDKSGTKVIEPQFDKEYSSGFSEGLVDVCKDEVWGYIDSAGNTVVPFEYDWTNKFSDGFALVKKKRQKFFINKQGEKLKTVKCTVVDSSWGGFKEGLAVVKLGKEYGFINTNGEQAIDELFDAAHGFHEGLCAVEKNGKTGYIDQKGEFIIEPKFERVDSFHLGVATFRENDKWGLIDKAGQVIKEPTYDFIHGFGLYGWGLSTKDERRLAKADLNKKEVYINLQGEWVADRVVNPRSKFDNDLLKNWKREDVWDKADWYYDGAGTTIKGATQHIYFVLKWLKKKELLTSDGLSMYAEKNNLDVSLWRGAVLEEAADFLDRYYKLWYENECIINFQIDPSTKFVGDENLEEYWVHYMNNR